MISVEEQATSDNLVLFQGSVWDAIRIGGEENQSEDSTGPEIAEAAFSNSVGGVGGKPLWAAKRHRLRYMKYRGVAITQGWEVFLQSLEVLEMAADDDDA